MASTALADEDDLELQWKCLESCRTVWDWCFTISTHLYIAPAVFCKSMTNECAHDCIANYVYLDKEAIEKAKINADEDTESHRRHH